MNPFPPFDLVRAAPWTNVVFTTLALSLLFFEHGMLVHEGFAQHSLTG
jgi:hypothetical protein